MNTGPLPAGQGLPLHACGVNEWLQNYRGLSEAELEAFKDHWSAPFLIREWEAGDVSELSRSTRPGARDLTIVFRSGVQLSCWDAPGWHALGRAIRQAEQALMTCPSLAADAFPDPRPSWVHKMSPLVSGFVYIHAPGCMTLGVYGARIFKGCDVDRLSSADRHLIGLYQRLIDRKRRFDKTRLSQLDKPLPFPVSLLRRRGRRS